MKTKYSIVRDYIEKNIYNGMYQADEKIESESELMKRFGISRHTVRLAIGDLVTEGLLYRVQGAGTYCADRTKGTNTSHGKTVKKIAVITTYISSYIFPYIIRGAESRLSEAGYQVSIFSTNNSFEKEREILKKVFEQKFDGVIIEPTKSAYSNPNISYYLKLKYIGIPFVMINEYYDVLEPVYVIVDDEQGGFIQVDHLLENGHNEIVGLFKTDDKQGIKRLKGFLRAYKTRNIKVNPTNIITYNTEEKFIKPLEQLENLLSEKYKITGIACYNDELAMEVLELLRNKKMKVPEDISLIGFDDSFLSRVTEVKLTSVTHPKNELGKIAAEKIIKLIELNKSKNQSDYNLPSKVFVPEVKKRNSICKLKP